MWGDYYLKSPLLIYPICSIAPALTRTEGWLLHRAEQNRVAVLCLQQW